jgi:multiple antibiotic resistance protein
MTDIGTLAQYALVAFLSIFIIVDLFATAPLFVTMTEGESPARRIRMALRASIAACLTLTAFALGGDIVLRLFAITLGAFRIAGGVILFSHRRPIHHERYRGGSDAHAANVAPTPP